MFLSGSDDSIANIHCLFSVHFIILCATKHDTFRFDVIVLEQVPCHTESDIYNILKLLHGHFFFHPPCTEHTAECHVNVNLNFCVLFKSKRSLSSAWTKTNLSEYTFTNIHTCALMRLIYAAWAVVLACARHLWCLLLRTLEFLIWRRWLSWNIPPYKVTANKADSLISLPNIS